MQVDSVGQAFRSVEAHAPRRASAPARHAGKELLASSPSQAATSAEATHQAASSRERTSPVLEKLLAGHYSAVAAVRYAIRFHAELAAASTSSAASDPGPVAYAVTARLTEALDEQALGEEARASAEAALTGFQDAVAALGEGATAGDAASLRTDLEAAFAELAASLDTLVEPPFLAQLRETFSESLERLQQPAAEVEGGFAFPEPNGNGVAFEKFLAIYRELAGAGGAADAQAEPTEEPVDLVA